jgi:hypothetical protein
MHNTSKCIWVRPFRTETASFMVVTAPMVGVSHVPLRLRVIIPWAVLLAHLWFRPSTQSAQPVVG